MKLHAPEPTHWLGCGKCLGCREMQQQELAIRVQHEARYYDSNHFLTLTYDEENLPDGLQKREMQLMWKRTRKATGAKFKHLTCGEYGERTQRPHYHAAVLGLPIDDLKKWDSENSTSETLTKIWGNGNVLIAPLTTERIRYVAGYVLKKAGYKKQIYCDPDGVELEPPFRTRSQGLGKTWIQDYKNDLRHGYLQEQKAKYSIPRYYKDILKKNDPKLLERIENENANRLKEMTSKDLECLHTGEKIRQQQLKDRRRDRV